VADRPGLTLENQGSARPLFAESPGRFDIVDRHAEVIDPARVSRSRA
jgi:hypothetical protein